MTTGGPWNDRCKKQHCTGSYFEQPLEWYMKGLATESFQAQYIKHVDAGQPGTLKNTGRDWKSKINK